MHGSPSDPATFGGDGSDVVCCSEPSLVSRFPVAVSVVGDERQLLAFDGLSAAKTIAGVDVALTVLPLPPWPFDCVPAAVFRCR